MGLVAVVVLLTLGPILTVTGALSIWLGTSGTVINKATVHFGATTTAEINIGIGLLSLGVAALAIFTALFFNDREFLFRPH